MIQSQATSSDFWRHAPGRAAPFEALTPLPHRTLLTRSKARLPSTPMTDKTDPYGVPSAPPIPVISRDWQETGDKSDTTLLHTAPKRPSKKRSTTVSSPSQVCGATSSHIPSKRPLQPSPRSPDALRRQSSGLIVRGSTYYLRLRVPRSLG